MNRILGFGPVLVLALAMAAACAVGLTLSRDNPTLIDGVPVGNSLEPWPVSVVGAPVTGRGVTYGFTVLTLARGADPIRITGVHLEGSQIRLIGARVLGPDRRIYQFTTHLGFPSRYSRGSVPATATVVTPAPRGYQLLLGLTGSGSGFLSSRWLDVSYASSDGESFVQRAPTAIVLCPSVLLMDQGVCEPPPSLRSLSP